MCAPPQVVEGKVATEGLLESAHGLPYQRQVLMETRERGYNVCRGNGRYYRGPTAVGTPTNVGVPLKCPPGTRLVAVFHTHPDGSPLPSATDMKTGRKHRIPYICVKARGKTRCYPTRRSK